MLNCRQISRLFSRSQDRPLTFKEKLSLRLHLMLCGACRRFAGQLRFLRQATVLMETRAFTEEPVKLSECARERIKRTLSSCGNNESAV
ncbi:MAG: zf-HC2 domain-containing protein [Methylococcaceae bacterium]|nr:MAG: zf-HC2 domain-containing protein [Methylococcaceae bacterium]